MAKKRGSASRAARKKDAADSDAQADEGTTSPSKAVQTNHKAHHVPPLDGPASEASNLQATSQPTSSLGPAAPQGHDKRNGDGDDLDELVDQPVAVEDGATQLEDDALPPALLMRTHAIDSTASSSSSISGALPRTRSLVLNDNATVLQAMPTSRVEVVEVVAEQSWLITKLTVQLLWALRASQKWILMALRLVSFVLLLLPALLRMVVYWGFDSHVHKNLIYGLKRRNLLDVYTVPSDKIVKPTKEQLHSKPRSPSVQSTAATTNEPPSQDVHELKRPVVVFLSGGAWIIGYKAWGSLMGKALAAFGFVVVMPDYRNFPQGTLPEMVEDATMALQWVFDNVHHFGGDPENVTLVGQSAGAHIAMCTLLEQVEKRSQRFAGDASSFGVASPSQYSSCSGFSVSSMTSDNGAVLPQASTWELRQIRTFIGISGPYNIENSIETFHRHGFDRSVVDRIMDHRISYFSPALRLFQYSEHARAIDLLHDFPPSYLYHGTADTTVSWKSSEQLASAMETCGLSVETKFFENKTHTDIIIEDPISGSDDLLLGQVIEVIKARSPRDGKGVPAFQFPEKFTPPRQYYPAVLVKIARYVNPF